MTHKEKGWVVINEKHPAGGPPYAIPTTFHYTRKGAIKNFCIGSGMSWQYWYRKYNFRCVKALSTITTD